MSAWEWGLYFAVGFFTILALAVLAAIWALEEDEEGRQ